ncbi:DUF429 domain-containing protein [Cellulomonas phragmiteti]|uniref:YCII-related domain-containing protein n=1 Tax=Cellulomonas phragmiteti TaxID=478780 RepID=A0ABQ4DRD0_9CELL|nr:DUF429 domain-containing protein [Cellulomonas phragmiteti]GIG41908.1 hypothetical protein Cph01nite_36700 [Cellulomonas phragmiteti]
MVRYVGLDLAWGTTARTGVAVLDEDGRLVHSSAVVTDAEIDALVEQHAGGHDVAVAIDAPLVVPNLTGQREAERLVTRHFGRFDAGAHPSSRSRPHFDPPRAEVLAARHGWHVDPAVQPGPGVSVAIEVYPHPAMVVLFGLGRVLPYKGKARRGFDVRHAAWLQLLDHVERVAGPTLGLAGNARWAQVRQEVRGAQRAAVLERLEDEVDAIVCAYLAWLWATERERMVVLGSVGDGYVVVPGLPTGEPTPRPVTGKVSKNGAVARRQGERAPTAVPPATRRSAMRYLLSVIDDATGTATPEEVAAIDAFNARLEADGHWVLAGGLVAPRDAVVVDDRDGRGLRTDGPFAETTEYLAGFWVLDAPDRETALALAADASRACRRRVELRAFLGG